MDQPFASLYNYPALDLSFNRFYISYLRIFESQILSFQILLMIKQLLFDEDDQPDSDPFISAIKIDQKIIKRFTQTFICVCEKDSLSDGALLFANKIIE